MDSMSAFLIGEAAAQAGNPLRVFDWHKAAELIRDRKPQVASAGLASDWEYTGGEIYRDGKPMTRNETYTYLASLWATPEIDLDGDVIDCWILKSESPGWDSDTLWPESALQILNSEKAAE